VNGDVIEVTMTSSEACPSPASVTAAQTMVVVPNHTPVASITVSTTDTVCLGSSVFFTATSLFGGTAPVYTWYKNGVSTGATGSVYTYAPVNGDVIHVKLNSNYRCPITNNVSSNNITMLVDSVHVPIAIISANTGTRIKTGTLVTFNISVTNAGPKPSYQWFVNTKPVPGATTSVYKTDTVADNDSISCFVWGTGTCSYYTFNSLKMKVSTGFVEPVAFASDFRLMPNPNNGEFVVNGTLATTANTEVALEVIDMLGQVVYKSTAMSRGSTFEERVKVSNTLANGMYMLNITSGGERKTLHFVLKQ
jgi:hypothetical protein